MNDDLTKLNDTIKKIRAERAAYVSTILNERQAELDRIATTAGVKPGAAELTIADFQNIENSYNKPLAELKERARIAGAEQARLSIPALEDRIDELKADRDAAAAILEEKESAVKMAERSLEIALSTVEKVKVHRYKIRFESYIPQLMSERFSPMDKKQFAEKILNY